MKEGLLKLFSFFATMVLMLVLVAIMAQNYGIVLHALWGWFVVPVFGLPNFPLYYAAGTSILISFLVGKPFLVINRSKKRDETDINETAFNPFQVECSSDIWEGMGKMLHKWYYPGIITPAAALFLGWIFHLLFT